jgi:hypothetical protein
VSGELCGVALAYHGGVLRQPLGEAPEPVSGPSVVTSSAMRPSISSLVTINVTDRARSGRAKRWPASSL